MKIEAKKYGVRDYVVLAVRSAPLCAVLIALNKIINGFLPSVKVLATAKFVDTAVAVFNGTAQQEDIFPSLILLAGIFAFQFVNWQLIGIAYLKMNIRLTETIQVAMVEKRSRLEYRHIENNDTWDLVSRTCKEPVVRIQDGYDRLFGVAEIAIRIVSLLSIIITQVWWAGLFILVISIPLFSISAKGGRVTYEAEIESEKLMRRSRYFSSVLSGRDTLEERALFGYTKQMNDKWFEKYEQGRKLMQRTVLKVFIRMKGLSLLTAVFSIAMIGILLPPLRSGSISIGIFTGLVTAVLDLVQMMSWHMNWLTKEFTNSLEYLKDLSAFSQLTEKEESLDLPADMSNMVFSSLEFCNVSFRYPDTERYILKDCSFSLETGRHYAFVGINGAGKTTITKLITGMYDDFEGEILINKKSIRDYKLSQLKGIFSVVYQDFAKYYIPAADSIKLGNVCIDDDARMQEAIHTIELEDAFEKLPEGIHTWLGKIKENGVDISGGEWQRVAIARSLYSNTLVSILDEPTAALDPMAESRIYEMYGKISRGKSTVFITHRLGAARLADEILVIDKGRVAEKGSHIDLIGEGGIYAGMFESQRGWYE